MKLSNFISKQELFNILQDNDVQLLPRQADINASYLNLVDPTFVPVRILDLGCGEEGSKEFFEKHSSDSKWYGVDIAESPEVNQRKNLVGNVSTYDGINIPFEDNYFDVVYSNQVFEHVRYPDKLAIDIARVLKPNGILIASVSYLEPYHSRSIFNFTPYGVLCVFQESGLRIKSLTPLADFSSVSVRQMLGANKKFSFIYNRNLFHFLFDVGGFLFRLDEEEISYLKLMFSGQILFICCKQDSVSSADE